MNSVSSRSRTSWYRVRLSGFLITGVALWYTLLVPLTDVSTPIGYALRISIVLVGLVFVGQRIITRVFEHRLPLRATLVVIGVTAALAGNAIVSASPGKFVDFVAFFGGVAGYFLIAERFPLRTRDVLTFVGIALVAGALLHVAAAPGTKGEFDLLPFMGKSWRVIIRSPHFTGHAAFFLLFASLLLSRQDGWRVQHVILLVISIYFLVFSGSRGSIAAAIATLGLWYVQPIRLLVTRSRFFAVAIPILAGLTMYLAPVLIFQSVSAEGFLGTLLKISPQQEDVTAGRLLTWLYHLDLFASNPWTGAPISMVTEGGGDVPLELKASNESFFTKVIAAQGMFGFLFYALFLYLSLISSKRGNYSAYVLSVSFVVITSVLGTFGNTYRAFSVLGYWLFFSLFLRGHCGVKDE